MLGAPMPEATIYEDRNSFRCEGKIGLPDYVFRLEPPASNAPPGEQPSELSLSAPVATRTDFRHDCGSGFLINRVHGQGAVT